MLTYLTHTKLGRRYFWRQKNGKQITADLIEAINHALFNQIGISVEGVNHMKILSFKVKNKNVRR